MAVCNPENPCPDCPQACPFAHGKESNILKDQGGLPAAAPVPLADPLPYGKRETPHLSPMDRELSSSELPVIQPATRAKQSTSHICRIAIESPKKTSSK